MDDNSPDGTAACCRALQKCYEKELNIRLLERPGKLGLGSAYLHALAHASESQFTVILDADLSHNPRAIADMYAKMQETQADIVTGTRYAKGGAVAGWPFSRIVISSVANFGAQMLLRPQASDLTGSFRLYRTQSLREILPKVKSRGYAFQMEIIVRATHTGLKIEEVPIVFVDRLYGETKIGFNEVRQFALIVIALFFELLW